MQLALIGTKLSDINVEIVNRISFELLPLDELPLTRIIYEALMARFTSKGVTIIHALLTTIIHEDPILGPDGLLAAFLVSSTIGQMAGWIGMEARTNAPVLFDSAPITVLPVPPIGATEMELVAYDANGREVARNAMPVSSEPVLWAGVQPGGAPLPAGLYRFEVEATSADENPLPATQADTYARIVEVQTTGLETHVVFEGGAEAPASSISALREAI